MFNSSFGWLTGNVLLVMPHEKVFSQVCYTRHEYDAEDNNRIANEIDEIAKDNSSNVLDIFQNVKNTNGDAEERRHNATD